jgi:hypothetical protein
VREKTASASYTLANNLAANATDGEETVHFVTMEQAMAPRQGPKPPISAPIRPQPAQPMVNHY